MKITTVLGAIAAAVLFFFGFIFLLSAGSNLLSSDQKVLRLIEGGILILVGSGIAYASYAVSRKPQTIIHQVEVSGQMKVAPLKCPNCSASIDASQIQIFKGVPYAICSYCGTTFEVTEEPKW